MENLANDVSGLLNAAIADGSTTSITMLSATGFPAVNFRIRIDNEYMLVTSVGDGTNWTVTRAIEGTTGVSHSNGAAVYQIVTVGGIKNYGIERGYDAVVFDSYTFGVDLKTSLALGKGIGDPTFTRTTTAYVSAYAAAANIADGQTLIQCASGEARFSGARRISQDNWSPNFADGTAIPDATLKGYLAEGAATNKVLWCRDLTNAAWTKLNMTAALDQVGMDGSANSASSLTATLANGSALQTITEAATLSALSLYIKRITGTGTVTVQQGATILDVTALINASTYTRVELDATVLNPAIGIVLATSGDKIAVDFVQFENTGFATSAIPTTTVAVTRNTDVLSYPSAGNMNTALGTAYAELKTLWNISPQNSVALGFDATSAAFISINGNPSTSLACYDLTNLANKVGLSDMSTNSRKRITSWGGANMSITGDGLALQTSAFDGTIGNIAIFVGIDSNFVLPWYGNIRNVRIWQQALSNAQLQTLTDPSSIAPTAPAQLTLSSVVGYAVGTGGVVTQITSRTTGVTLNTTNGAITLVSAAGTATWQTFTVTNSMVAVSDLIKVVQKSGTDLYQIFVTNVAAGSFKVTFATTGGTTTEQPVFTFVLIKGATT